MLSPQDQESAFEISILGKVSGTLKLENHITGILA